MSSVVNFSTKNKSGYLSNKVNCIEQIFNRLPDHINEIYTNVVNEIINLQCLNFSVPIEDSLRIKQMVEEFSKGNPQPINYDKYWRAFNKNFFLKNLYKAFITIAYLQSHGFIAPNTDLPIIDVGCGAGVFAIAWMKLFSECISTSIFIDRNRFQLELARQIAIIFKARQFEFYNASFPDEFDQLHGIRLFSYWFCEQEDIGALFEDTNSSKVVGEGALVIDYRYIIDRLQNVITPKYIFTRWAIRVEDSPKILFENNQKEQYIYGAYFRP